MDIQQTIITKQPEIASRQVGPSFLLSYKNNTFQLNKTAVEVWQNIDGHKSIAEIIDLISQKFDVELDTAKNDVLELINLLVEEGMLIVTEENDKFEGE